MFKIFNDLMTSKLGSRTSKHKIDFLMCLVFVLLSINTFDYEIEEVSETEDNVEHECDELCVMCDEEEKTCQAERR